uniref:G-patch domain-containing protein n=1 Tax=Meloidogyne javanica TaxID=6303 RepID=A0A915LGJ1_MELJA
KLKSGQKGRKLAEENELMKSGKFGVDATIMSKMGYREGFGLGAKEQGISRALQVQRTGGNVGLIVGEEKASAAITTIYQFSSTTAEKLLNVLGFFAV